MLKDTFGFAEHHEKGTYGLGSKLKLTGNSDNAVLNKGKAINNAKINFNSMDWYVPHYLPSLNHEKLLMSQIVKKNLRYVERSAFKKELNTQNIWTLELGTQDGVKVPIWVILGFQQKDWQHDQNLNNDTFYRPPVISAQCIIGTEKNPARATLLNNDEDDYSQGYAQIKETCRALSKDDKVKPYISDNHDLITIYLDHLKMVLMLDIIYTFSI